MKSCIPGVDILKICCGFLMELELILTELHPFELSHFRQLFCMVGYGVCHFRQLFCIVGYGVCVINSPYILMNYFETCKLIVDISKMCM